MSCQVLPVGHRRRLKYGVRVEGVVDPEVQVGHSTVAGCRQDLGQHGDDAVLVLRQPGITVSGKSKCLTPCQTIVYVEPRVANPKIECLTLGVFYAGNGNIWKDENCTFV